MRLFSAVPLPTDVKDKIRDVTRNRLPVPYVNITNAHVTLNFFGELDSDQEKKLKQIFPRSVEGKTQFEIVFDKIVKFHNQLHLTVSPNKELMQLHSEMSRYFEANGFKLQDREYYPHVKLVNLHMDKVMHRERKLENFPNEELAILNFRATQVILYESKLLLHHAHHVPLLECELT